MVYDFGGRLEEADDRVLQTCKYVLQPYAKGREDHQQGNHQDGKCERPSHARKSSQVIRWSPRGGEGQFDDQARRRRVWGTVSPKAAVFKQIV